MKNSHLRAMMMLSIFPPDLRDEIVSFCVARGSVASRDVSELEDAADVPAFMTLFSRQYIDDRDMGELMIGFSTIVLDGLKSKKTGIDSYSTMLQTAYGLPEKVADAMANNIETEDDWSKMDPTWYNKLSQTIQSATRQSINSVMSTGPLSVLSWEMDQDQTYDLDMLYEWKTLGAQVKKLNSRVRLMSAQSMIASQIDLFPRAEAGDVDYGDVESYIGDLVSKVAAPNLPAQMYGGIAPLVMLHRAANKVKLANVIKASGLGKPKVSSAGIISGSKPMFGKVLAKLTAGKPGKKGILGFLRKKRMGDIDDELIDLNGASQDQKANILSTLHGQIGDAVAHAYETGDINPLVREMAELAAVEETTGDVDLDEALIAGDMSEDPYGDVDEMGEEVGGLFTRMRTNMALRRAARRKARGKRKSTRRQARWDRKQQMIEAKDKAKQATETYDEPEEEDDYSSETDDMQSDNDNMLDSSSDSPDMNLGAFDNA